MTYMKLGNVLSFPNAKPDKAQALKVLEEGAVLMGWILCIALFVLTLVCIVSLAAMAIAITITIITELL